MSRRNDVLKYGKDTYDATPDHPWQKFPNYAVLRHSDTDKWFALVMDIPKGKIGLEGEDIIDVLDVKCDPDEIGTLRKKDGYFSAYHMNKEHWITVLLDGTVPMQEIKRLIDASHRLTT